MQGTTLDVGDDRLILYVQRNKYHLDLKFPHVVDYESGGAQFDRKTKVCTVHAWHILALKQIPDLNPTRILLGQVVYCISNR